LLYKEVEVVQSFRTLVSELVFENL